MIRVVIFLALVAAIALGAAWIVDRPGDVAVNWLGYRIETSVTVALAAVVLLLAVALAAWSLLRLLFRTPAIVRHRARERRRGKAHRAQSQGLIAIASGDLRAAERHAREAVKLARNEPLTLLLQAQGAQLSGNRGAAEAAFRTMAARRDTRLLGLRGLYVEARRRNDAEAARRLADTAAQSAPALPWAAEAALEFRCATGDWAGALAALDRNARHRLVDRETVRRYRAVLLTAYAGDLAEAEPAKARSAAQEAAKLAADLVPAAVLAAKLTAEAGEWRRAGKILEAAWRRNPHPDIAELYAHLRFGDAARDRLARVQHLARLHPGHVESAIAIARTAIDAQEFATARRALAAFIEQPTQRVALLMADLEQSEHADAGGARAWMARALRARRDPAWTADGFVSDRWLPVSPVTGRIDAFEWKTPVAELAAGTATVEHDEWASRELDRLTAPPALLDHAPEQAVQDSADTGGALVVEPSAEDKASAPPALPDPEQKPEPAATAAPAEPSVAVVAPVSEPAPPPTPASKPSRFGRQKRAEPVIPLVHAPDDPGPEGEPETSAEPEIIAREALPPR